MKRFFIKKFFFSFLLCVVAQNLYAPGQGNSPKKISRAQQTDKVACAVFDATAKVPAVVRSLMVMQDRLLGLGRQMLDGNGSSILEKGSMDELRGLDVVLQDVQQVLHETEQRILDLAEKVHAYKIKV